MQALLKLCRMALYVLAFAVLTGLLARMASHLNARNYVEGAVPAGYFPVLALAPAAPQSGVPQYRLLRWSELQDKAAPPPALRLPEQQGSFVLSEEDGFESSVDFQVTGEQGGRQTVQLTARDDDYMFFSRYTTDGVSVYPLYLRVLGRGEVMMAMVPALLLTWLLGRGIAWAWRRRRPAA